MPRERCVAMRTLRLAALRVGEGVWVWSCDGITSD